MPCPYLDGKHLKVCAVFPAKRDPATAGKGAMVLSIGELKDYCATEESFKGCQFFKEVKLNEGEAKQKTTDMF